MKKLLGIVVLVLFWCNSVLAVSLPKDVTKPEYGPLHFHLYRLWFRGAWLMAPGNRTPLNNFEYLSLENIKTFL